MSQRKRSSSERVVAAVVVSESRSLEGGNVPCSLMLQYTQVDPPYLHEHMTVETQQRNAKRAQLEPSTALQ